MTLKRKVTMKFYIFFITLSIISCAGCSKLANDASLLMCSGLETNPNFCAETISKNYWDLLLPLVGLFISINPITTNDAEKIKLDVNISSKSNQPKKIAKTGVRKEKLATPEAG